MAERAGAFAPGRVNLIGEHTDYNDGLALPFAIERGVTVWAQAVDGPQVRVLAVDLDERDEFDAEDPPPAEGWQAFSRGVVAELRRSGTRLPRGAEIEISGDVPRGGGLSSSAALSVALALVLCALANEPEPDRIGLARLCSAVENHWVGARTGLLDQLASLFGCEGHAVLIDFASLELTSVPLALGQATLVTLDSGETHTLGESGYNRRREECARACELLEVPSLRQATAEAIDALPSPLRQRAQHVMDENHRVRQAVGALERRDGEALAALLSASHASLRDLYEVSTPAVERTVERLRRAGALGARLVGGGFGGSVLAMMPAGAELPEGAIEVRPGPGAGLLDA